jgi:hypothetical protein
MRTRTARKHSCTQYTGNPADNSKRTQDWLKKNLMEVWEKKIWPPSSFVCSPVDYFAWGVSELRIRAQIHNKSKGLIPKIKKVMGSLHRNTVAKACKRFRSQIETVVAVDGSFIV